MAETIDYGRLGDRLRESSARGPEARWELLRAFQREGEYREGGEQVWPRGAEAEPADQAAVETLVATDLRHRDLAASAPARRTGPSTG
ncbi:hypothetical protein [Spirillospora sp. NPDC047279]|uniref:hypothetical protein n=1 Tax=Spirillospora sp. NPDC047279 TaxID=3155478 RepID=UPI0033DE4DF9